MQEILQRTQFYLQYIFVILFIDILICLLSALWPLTSV